MPSDATQTEYATENRRGSLIAKRIFDVGVSLFCVVLFSPVLLIAALAVKLTSRGPVLYLQQRVGQNFQPFKIFKFRTMAFDADKRGALITVDRDPRITSVGHFLRKSKIDELPQFFNILRGDMSLVGPRPEVPKYVEMFRQDFAELLSIRPGLTDLASIEFRDESEVLGRAADPEREYTEVILPRKISISREYMKDISLRNDLRIIGLTVREIFR